jgi:hypothetical protein
MRGHTLITLAAGVLAARAAACSTAAPQANYADIYLDGPPAGALITVTVGGATCTTSD